MIPILERLNTTLNNQMSSDKASYTQDLLCGLLQVILIKVGPMIQMPLAINIIQIIIQIFKQAEKVTENGLIAFQGLVVGFGEQIEITEIGSYIKYALQSKDNECTKLACGIVSDLSTGMGERIGEYLDDFVPCLHEILRDQTLDRRIKLPALTALGDLCMYSGVAFNQKYLDSTLSIMNIAARASVNITGLDNDTLEFLS